jgi:hypothetical protein
MAMGNSLSQVISNIFMENFEGITVHTAEHKLAKWLRYVKDTFVVWPQGPAARLQQFLHHLTSLRPTIKFIVEVEANDILPFLDVLVMKRGPKLITKVQPPTSREKRSNS